MKKYKDIIFSEQAFQRAVHKPSTEVGLNESFTTLNNSEVINETKSIDTGFSATSFSPIQNDESDKTQSFEDIRAGLKNIQDQLKELDSLKENDSIGEISFSDIEPEVYDESQSRGFGR